MIQLVYMSSASALFSQAELMDLLTRSRINNERQGVTGLLLYKEGNFLQIIEADEVPARALLQRIQADPRHTGITLLLDEPVTRRSFPDWSMGFRNLSDLEVQALPGYSSLMNNTSALRGLDDAPSHCRALIEFFRSGR
jgi:hypothetical protein